MVDAASAVPVCDPLANDAVRGSVAHEDFGGHVVMDRLFMNRGVIAGGAFISVPICGRSVYERPIPRRTIWGSVLHKLWNFFRRFQGYTLGGTLIREHDVKLGLYAIAESLDEELGGFVAVGDTVCDVI
jgi:hypothetical protein